MPDFEVELGKPVAYDAETFKFLFLYFLAFRGGKAPAGLEGGDKKRGFDRGNEGFSRTSCWPPC